MVGIIFGPVPSRRLGRSLGVNNIPPPKTCTYSCVYCQLGKTRNLSVLRRSYYGSRYVADAVQEALEHVDNVDYVTFVPDGEPTLDLDLGEEAKLIKKFSTIPLAVLTNSSLISGDDVRKDLLEFDLVSVKIDAAGKEVWRRINRPHPSLSHDEILKGLRIFRKEFPGRMISETMLVKGVNTERGELEKVSEVISELEPDKAYISMPIRPPAENWVAPPSEEELVEAYEIFAEVLGRSVVELLTGYEGPDFTLMDDPAESLIRIASIHPVRLDYALQALSEKVCNPREFIEELLRMKKLSIVSYRGESFLVRGVEK